DREAAEIHGRRARAQAGGQEDPDRHVGGGAREVRQQARQEEGQLTFTRVTPPAGTSGRLGDRIRGRDGVVTRLGTATSRTGRAVRAKDVDPHVALFGCAHGRAGDDV